MIKINDIELEFNGLDADERERAEDAVTVASQKTEELKADTVGRRPSQIIREICKIVFDCFNTIFGEGTDRAIFGSTCDMGQAIDAFGQLTAQIRDDDGGTEVDNILKKYAPNREQRKATKKK